MKYNNEYVSGNIEILNTKIKIKGNLLKTVKAHIISANPPDKLINYSGNSLPFPNSEIAFENTSNKYEINGTSYDIEFSYPNSYYCTDNLNEKIPPAVYFVINPETEDSISIRFDLPDKCNLKTLINRNNMKHQPDFYDSKYQVLEVATAEKTMYAYADYKKIANKG